MKIKKEYVILAVVIFALAGYLLVKKTNRLHYTLPKIPVIPQKEISKIEIQKGDQQTVLTQKEAKWFIIPGNYLADKIKMGRILDAIGNFSISALISESGDYLRYDLTKEKKIGVKVYEKKARTFSFSVGKHAPTFQHTFVTIEGGRKVYLARGNFHSDFDKSAADLRDKHVFSFNKKQLSMISISAFGKAFELKKVEAAEKTKKKKTQPNSTFQWTDAEGKAVSESAVNAFLSQLTDLQCASFADKKIPQKKEAIFRIVLKGKKDVTLEIFKKDDIKDQSFPAVSSSTPYPFTLQNYKVDMIKKAAAKLHVDKNPPESDLPKTNAQQ